MGARLAVLVLVVWCSTPAPSASPQQTALRGFLDRYEAGQHDATVATLTSVERFDAYARSFVTDGALWIAAAPTPEVAAKRRLTIATLILEVAHARLVPDWAELRSVVEWACSQLRLDPPSAAERQWHLAALAVIDGAFDPVFMRTPPPLPPKAKEPLDPAVYGYSHAAHVHERFPDEPRFALSVAKTAERRVPDTQSLGAAVAIPSVLMERLAARNASLGKTAVEGFTELLDDPLVGAEARLRLGYLRQRLGETSLALDAYASVSTTHGADPYVSYLAHFLTARLHELANRMADAEAAYRKALDAMPGVHSGATALSALLFQGDRPDEAYEVMTAAMAVRPRPVDPWRLLGYGDYYRWPLLIGPLRANLR